MTMAAIGRQTPPKLTSKSFSIWGGQIIASMGPQPFGCGRSLAMIVKAATPLLQWGRNLSVAEGTKSATGRPCAGSFNGAATFRLRKVTLQRAAHP